MYNVILSFCCLSTCLTQVQCVVCALNDQELGQES